MECYEPHKSMIVQGALPLQDLYGKFPEAPEIMVMVRKIYGDDFMEIFEKSFNNLESDFTEDGLAIHKTKVDNAV